MAHARSRDLAWPLARKLMRDCPVTSLRSRSGNKPKRSVRPPIVADSVQATREQLRLGNPESPRHWRPEVPRELEAVCLKCLNKEPADRYPNAAAVAEDLRRFRTNEVLFIDGLDEI